MKIALDAGHGVGDPGAVNQELGLYEANVAYDIVQAIKKALVGYEIFETDRSLYSDQRARQASKAGAKLLVSIHLNSGPPEAKGFEIWYHHNNIEGDKLATCIAKSLDLFLPHFRGIKDDYYWRPPTDPNWTGGMGILREFDGPACLVEVLFLSNREEAMACLDGNFIKKVSELIAMGIRSYADSDLFPDVKDEQTRKAVLSLFGKQIIKGYPDGTFHPDEALTRGQMAIIIDRLLTYLGKE